MLILVFVQPGDVPGDYQGLSERFVTYCHEIGTSFRGTRASEC